jgi:hypothetical protein
MNKTKSIFLLAFFAVGILFTSCKKDEVVNESSSVALRLAKDQVFLDVVNASVNLYNNTSKELLDNKEKQNELLAIATKIQDKTATEADYKSAEAILGVKYEDFILNLKNFGTSIYALNQKYPNISKMKNDEMSKLFADAIAANPELSSSLGQSALVNGRIVACPLRDICKLAVTLAALFGGEPLCVAINVSTIPVIGGLLCQLILNIGTNILNGICMALPC